MTHGLLHFLLLHLLSPLTPIHRRLRNDRCASWYSFRALQQLLSAFPLLSVLRALIATHASLTAMIYFSSHALVLFLSLIRRE